MLRTAQEQGAALHLHARLPADSAGDGAQGRKKKGGSMNPLAYFKRKLTRLWGGRSGKGGDGVSDSSI